MPYELFLAFRYLRSRPRRLARVTSVVAIFGIAIGVAALVVALALTNGFRDEIQNKILAGTSHINIMRVDGQPISDHRKLSKLISSIEGVANASGTTYTEAVVVGSTGSAYAVLRGLDRDSDYSREELKDLLAEGSLEPLLETTSGPSPPAVLVGSELADRTGLRPGATAEIIPATVGSLAYKPLKRVVRVAGIFRVGLFEYDSTWVYLPLETASLLSGTENSAGVISVHLHDIYKVKEITAYVLSTLGPTYKAIDWQEANRPLFTALELERRMGLFIIALIIMIASLNIATTLILIVIERRHDIAVINTMGATSRSIMIIFMIEGAVIGLIGAASGILLANIGCVLGNRYKLVSLPADVYSISSVPFNTSIRDAVLAAVVAFILSIIATIYPARAAARVRPVEMLRDT